MAKVQSEQRCAISLEARTRVKATQSQLLLAKQFFEKIRKQNGKNIYSAQAEAANRVSSKTIETYAQQKKPERKTFLF
ncbi:MAG: hypothetical protein JST06_05250 [Bacteroidetes bacterium]|nr:hypothetical protein [Bacteroidota bacterium]MBS1629834.1 hypothetical protein [Bacteroidota bacterium]